VEDEVDADVDGVDGVDGVEAALEGVVDAKDAEI